jgi:hypothetical protein
MTARPGPQRTQPARPRTRPAAKPQARQIGELIGPTLDPVIRKRGLAKADILAWWPDIVGKAYAGKTRPERIRWPRASDPGAGAATLIVRCDPSVALQLAHETDQIRERLNRFLGFQAVGAVRIVQHPISAESEASPETPPQSRAADPDRLAMLDESLKPLDGPLAQSLKALGRNVLARS